MKITLLRLPGANRQERTPLFTPAARSSASMPPAAAGGAARAALLTRSTPAARRVGVAGVAMLAALAALLSVSKPADAALSKMGAVDATTNFPSYYEDSTGLRLEPCLDGPPLCFAAPSDLKAPDGEAFYNNATAGPLTTGRVGGTTGKAVLVLAQEAAYAADGSGQEITFTRIRFTDSAGLTPGATYKVTHPFGTDSFVANASGAVPKNVGTEDIGGIGPCIGPNAHAAGGACDFGVSMTGRFGPFLKWDPAVAPAAPTGYLGDNATPHAIVGSPTGTNVFRIEGPNVNPTTTDQCPTVSGVIANCLETKLFTVEGKIAGPLLPSPSSLAFGSQPLGTQSATKTVTVKNVWATSITLRSVALDTASGDPTAFTIAPGGTCTVGKALARDATCPVNVQFTPTPTTAVGTRTATVLITHNGIRSPERIALTGSAATPGTAPAVGSLPASIAFADPQRLSTTSAPQDVTITNTGTADLNVAGVALGGKDATDFSAQNTCVGTAVAPGASCTVTVLFAPQQTGGAKT